MWFNNLKSHILKWIKFSYITSNIPPLFKKSKDRSYVCDNITSKANENFWLEEEDLGLRKMVGLLLKNGYLEEKSSMSLNEFVWVVNPKEIRTY